jgi:hypothetical protein
MLNPINKNPQSSIMNRRKFLYSGSFGFLGLQGALSGVVSIFENGQPFGSVQFLEWIRAKKKNFVLKDNQNEKLSVSFQKYVDLGYEINPGLTYELQDNRFFVFQLKDTFSVIDEVILLFKGTKNPQFISSINPRQMDWFLKNRNAIEHICESNNIDIFEFLLPVDQKRRFKEGVFYFESFFAHVGFNTTIRNDKTICEGIVENKIGEILLSSTVESTFYPWKKVSFI